MSFSRNVSRGRWTCLRVFHVLCREQKNCWRHCKKNKHSWEEEPSSTCRKEEIGQAQLQLYSTSYSFVRKTPIGHWDALNEILSDPSYESNNEFMCQVTTYLFSSSLTPTSIPARRAIGLAYDAPRCGYVAYYVHLGQRNVRRVFER